MNWRGVIVKPLRELVALALWLKSHDFFENF